MGFQTLLFVAAALGAFIAWRQLRRPSLEAKAAAEPSSRACESISIRISDTVDEAGAR